MQSRFRLRIGNDPESSLGPGKVALLEAIEETGSISAAGRKLGMSYRRAWLLVDALNHAFNQPLITTATGGREGGGTALTPAGADVVRRYRRIEAMATAATAKEINALQKLMRG
ncbi:MAG: LysR family transcriptional regulator [Betaproteobacteria bacterium]|nr:LysR family transcriptional regulator [Betaproteobacteria bacterium]